MFLARAPARSGCGSRRFSTTMRAPTSSAKAYLQFDRRLESRLAAPMRPGIKLGDAVPTPVAPEDHLMTEFPALATTVLWSQDRDSTRAPLCAAAPSLDQPCLAAETVNEQVQAAQTRLLYENANIGIVVTIVIASLLAYAQWDVVSPAVAWAWLLYMLLVSAARFMLVRRYWRASPSDTTTRWNVAFVVGAALAAAGWGAAAIVLHAPARPMNETFLVFVVGGVMLGGASLLAARPEAFLIFLLPPVC